MINTFYDFPSNDGEILPNILLPSGVPAHKTSLFLTEFLSNFFFSLLLYPLYFIYVPNHFYLSMWMLLNEQAKRRNPKMDLIWTCEGRTLWRRKLDSQLGICKGITICVLYTTDCTNIQNVIFNIVFITNSKLKYPLCDISFKKEKSFCF